MKEPILVIMAAGMGSRFGGLKQMTPIGPNGEWILEYSLYDGKKAGFKEAVIIIKEENENLMRELIDKRIGSEMKITYAYQKQEDIPKGETVPKGRTKPWGTGQAVLAAKSFINGPFAVINADDYYGQEAFRLIYNHLKNQQEETAFAMVGYFLKNTLSESGSVSRGVCQRDEKDYLTSIVERVHIIQTVDGPMFTEDKKNYVRLEEETIVSMNMWGFTKEILPALEKSFITFFKEKVPNNPMKSEFFLPFSVETMLEEKQAIVKVFATEDKWYGITYSEDVTKMKEALNSFHQKGLYPEKLWN